MRNVKVVLNLDHWEEIHEKFYRDLDYCIIPSIWSETGPMTLFESFAHKIPVLINNLESMKEKIKGNKSSKVFNGAFELESLIRGILEGRIKREANDIYPFKSNEVFSNEMIEIYKRTMNRRNRSLFFKVGHLCNSKCLYCVAGEAVETFVDLIFIKKELEEKAPIYDRLVFTGGEPAMYPKFFELLAVSFYFGYKIDIQSNIRMFSSKRFTEKTKKFNTRIIVCINSSRAEIFDIMAQVKGAFKQTILGVENLKNAGVDVDTKIIITKHNQDHLTEIVRFIKGISRSTAT